MLQMDSRTWFAHPKAPLEVHAHTGQPRHSETHKPLTIFRHYSRGMILVSIPKYGQLPLARAILTALVGEPSVKDPRQIRVSYQNGNKWDLTPANLEWEHVKNYMERLAFEDRLLKKMDGPAAFTLQTIIEALTQEQERNNSKKRQLDIEAVGSVFRIGADMAERVRTGKSWAFVKNYMGEVKSTQVDRKMEEAREAIRVYSQKDMELVTRMRVI